MKISTRSLQTILTEFMGTFFIVYISCWSFALYRKHTIRIVELAAINGFTVASLTWAGLPYSGAHFNPVINAVQGCLQRTPISNVLVYTGIQLVASFFAALIAMMTIVTDHQNIKMEIRAYPIPDQTYSNFQIFFVEFIGSFLYIMVYSATVSDKRAPSNVFGFAIGGLFMMTTLAFGTVTGACLNPVRIFGPQLVNWNFSNGWMYWLANGSGGLFAGFYYDFFLRKIDDDVAAFDEAHGEKVDDELNEY